MKKDKLFSICIPSYNRPIELRRLLDSIDTTRINDIEIVICEDNAPKRKEVSSQVDDFKKTSPYELVYIENENNCGYDKNLRNLINSATGDYILFMGDDDMFIPGRLDGFINFVVKHPNCGYFLRCYQNISSDGSIAEFKYFKEDMVFMPSVETYISMFDKSVFISGFTVKRNYAKAIETEQFDGSLLYQMYLLTEICRKYPSGYYNIPITQAIEGGVPFFGNSESEKDLYDPGTVSVRNSVNFMRWYCKLIDFSAEKYKDDSNYRIRHNMSKYSYSFMCEQRDKGISVFNSYVKELKKMGFASSCYFYIYYVGLILIGTKNCSSIIKKLKKLFGRRPQL